MVIDWRNVNGRNFVSPVRSQRIIGSCAAVSVVSAMEIQERIMGVVTLPELSEVHLFFSDTQHNWLTGWSIEAALEQAKQTGVVPADCCAFGGWPDILRHRCQLCEDWQELVTRISGYCKLVDVEEMKQWLSTHGPLIAGFTIYSNLHGYKSGVYRSTEEAHKIGNHSVCVIGYDDTNQAWLCQNSYGAEWGDHGYFWIGYGQCGIDDEMWGIEGFTRIYQP